MEKRHARRIKSDIPCRLVSRSLNFSGLIEDLTENGICVLILPTRAVEDIPCGMNFMVKFQIPSGDTIDLQCTVRQAYKTSPDKPTNNVGMEINQQPPEYKAFLATRDYAL